MVERAIQKGPIYARRRSLVFIGYEMDMRDIHGPKGLGIGKSSWSGQEGWREGRRYLNVVPTDHEGRISRSHGPQAPGNPTPIRAIGDQIMEIGPPPVER